jgi:Rad52/22 family double-strand break repair protein
MGFSAKQTQALRRHVERKHVRIRQAHGRVLSYIEGWYAIAQANRIFGFDGWNRETVDARCVLTRENRGSFIAVYIARVRITVRASHTTILREGHGSGEGRGTSPGEVHDIALKAAETDATKRALATFGKPFGLALYASVKPAAAPIAPALQPSLSYGSSPQQTFARDDTTSIPRPSRYYGRRQDVVTRELAPQRHNQVHTGDPGWQPPSESSIVPAPPDQLLGRIDKSVLAIGAPKRLRDKAHLKFVAAQPCLVCGRQPSDPHHLRFAQPRAIGLKVSDEFTVPLCRGHHRQLHQASNEVAWWQTNKIDVLPIAKALWEKTRPASAQPSMANHASANPDNPKPGIAAADTALKTAKPDQI